MSNVQALKEELKNFLNEKLELLTEDLAEQFANKFGKGTFIDLPVNYLLEVQKETNFFQLSPNGFCHFDGNLPARDGEVVETFGFSVLYKEIPFTFSVKMNYWASDFEVEFGNVYLTYLQTLEEMETEFKKEFKQNPLKAYFALKLS